MVLGGIKLFVMNGMAMILHNISLVENVGMAFFVAEDVRRTIRMESLYFVVLIKDFLKVL